MTMRMPKHASPPISINRRGEFEKPGGFPYPIPSHRLFLPTPFASSNEDPPLSCESARTASALPNACLTPGAPAEPTFASATSALVQKFTRSDQPAFIAAPPPPSSSTSAPPIPTVRPDQSQATPSRSPLPPSRIRSLLGAVLESLAAESQPARDAAPLFECPRSAAAQTRFEPPSAAASELQFSVDFAIDGAISAVITMGHGSPRAASELPPIPRGRS